MDRHGTNLQSVNIIRQFLLFCWLTGDPLERGVTDVGRGQKKCIRLLLQHVPVSRGTQTPRRASDQTIEGIIIICTAEAYPFSNQIETGQNRLLIRSWAGSKIYSIWYDPQPKNFKTIHRDRVTVVWSAGGSLIKWNPVGRFISLKPLLLLGWMARNGY